MFCHPERSRRIPTMRSALASRMTIAIRRPRRRFASRSTHSAQDDTNLNSAAGASPLVTRRLVVPRADPRRPESAWSRLAWRRKIPIAVRPPPDSENKYLHVPGNPFRPPENLVRFLTDFFLTPCRRPARSKRKARASLPAPNISN